MEEANFKAYMHTSVANRVLTMSQPSFPPIHTYTHTHTHPRNLALTTRASFTALKENTFICETKVIHFCLHWYLKVKMLQVLFDV